MTPRHAANQLAAEMKRWGFTEVGRGSGSSHYLIYGGDRRFKLRVSDHQWGSGAALNGRLDVISNFVVTGPKTAAELEAMAPYIACRFVIRVRIRLGRLGKGDGSQGIADGELPQVK